MDERYLLWYDNKSFRPIRDGASNTVHGPGPIHLHIVLKDGYTVHDQLKAWTHAAELCSTTGTGTTDREAISLIRSSHKCIVQYFPDFIARMRAAGWNTVDGPLMPGSPRGVLMGVNGGLATNGGEEKKVR